ncbi:GNAT family N-acetyltransferase [Chitinophaga pendula]|uniref:GNAT family N-acetyltransferase n=1 Tax=Chitinophaga TaxID=79328 RepID=UPI000BAFCB4F|nr:MULTISPECIES: GNAT family N-acetyltransferase [Chitinophaga]ASZ12655.1 GNAT family N-acetyltransferase [Chitinophaga sp. MD30]UCJ09734.1 GNAT family N-acetyltransferase [Chitinophaga pendula]
MDQQDFAVLDNCLWHALRDTQHDFSLGQAPAFRFRPEILPFIGFDHRVSAPLAGLQPFMAPGEQVFVVGDLPDTLSGWTVLRELDGAQMVCPQLLPGEVRHLAELQLLNENDWEEMHALVQAVQPGYYRQRTPLLGLYWGIKVDGKLAAMAGERFRLPGFTEVSAVCTYPAHTGKGYAQQLTTAVCRHIYAQGAIPFLHVLKTNTRAIALYERLGFYKRRDIPFYQVSAPL